jgi:hypothetical protein
MLTLSDMTSRYEWRARQTFYKRWHAPCSQTTPTASAQRGRHTPVTHSNIGICSGPTCGQPWRRPGWWPRQVRVYATGPFPLDYIHIVAQSWRICAALSDGWEHGFGVPGGNERQWAACSSAASFRHPKARFLARYATPGWHKWRRGPTKQEAQGFWTFRFVWASMMAMHWCACACVCLGEGVGSYSCLSGYLADR